MKINFFQNRELKKSLSTQKRVKNFSNLEGMKDILIFFNIDDWYEVETVIQDLENLGKNVVAWTVKPKPSKEEDSKSVFFPSYVKVIDLKNDLTWKKTLSPDIIEEFDRLHYDTLLDLTISDNPHLQYFLARNKSASCLGIKESELKMYDFAILKSDEQSIIEAYEQIKFYLQNIKSNTDNF